ncbi:MAG: T9SS type A sorting domain-containing protein [Ignavibacteriales bacterium]|nr:MAG: T9SS type A sorting domain-containing protein [Ignavibacteriales bacterium]
MKAGLLKSLFISLIMFSLQTFGQNPEWINYTDGNLIFSTVEDDDYYWAATYGGLSRVSKTNGEIFVFTKANSDLPDNYIYCMTQDSNGIKWLGTYSSGIIKFDGNSFTTYNSSNTLLPDNKINSIAVDHQDNLWAGTDSGLVKYDGVNWTLYDFQNLNYTDIDVGALFVDDTGDLWVSTQELLRFNGTTWTEYLDQIWPIYSIDQGPDGTIWFGGNDLKKFDGINWTTVTGFPDDQIMSLSVDVNNVLWVGTAFKGLASFNGTNWFVYNKSNTPFREPWIMHVRVNNSNDKIIGTQKGLYKFNNISWSEIETSNSSLPSNYIERISISPNGKIWMSGIHGLCSFDNEEWQSYPELNTDSAWTEIQSLKVSADNMVWIGTYHQGLIKFDGINQTIFNTSNSPIPSNWISSIEIDAMQIMWIGTGNGLVKYDGINWTVYNTGNSGLPGNGISTITIDSEGKKWIGTNGVAVFNDSTWIVYDTTNSGLPSNTITAIDIDSTGIAWIATHDDGLAVLTGTTWTLYNTLNSILPTIWIEDVTIDLNNQVWIGCSDLYYPYDRGGLVRYDGNQWELLNTNNSELPGNYLKAIEIDQFNNKWIAMLDGGVSVFNENGITLPVELISFTAEVLNNTVNLKWSTASELNNRGFEVERKQVASHQSSVNNSEWNTIGFVDGSGTQSQTHNYNFIDSSVTSGRYSYRLKQIDFNGTYNYSNVVEVDLSLPLTFSLEQNFPNPFNPTTKIRYTVGDAYYASPTRVLLRIYNILGSEVATLVNEVKPAGSYEIEFDASQLASGVYFYSLTAGDFKMTKKMVMLK